jgi:hypothetical protein
MTGISAAAHETTATIEVNGSAARRAAMDYRTRFPCLSSRRVRSGDFLVAATASVQIAVLEEFVPPTVSVAERPVWVSW